MTALSSLLGGSGIKAIHTGYANDVSPTGTGGTGEDKRYWDITISVTDYTKCVPIIRMLDDLISDNSDSAVSLTARLTSNTNLRISNMDNDTAGGTLKGRYHIIEYE